MPMDLTLWLELGAFVLLLAFSAFFSSSETSLFSLSQVQLEQMRRDDNPRIDLIERLLSAPRRLIVTILIGNEFVNVAASVISAGIVIRILGAENKFANLLIMVPILLLFGEITPKTLAIRKNVPFATFQSRPIDLFATYIKPLRILVRMFAEFFITLIVGKERTRGNILTEDMVRSLAREAVGDGVLHSDEARYIEQIFEFGDRTVGDLKTPRSKVFFIPANSSFEEVIAHIRESRHTKIPVCGHDRDHIVGMLHSRDLLGIRTPGSPDRTKVWQERLREPYFVPESKSAAELFRSFGERRRSVALVVDEFGGVTGLITMEDLLECIFGDIPSPSETRKNPSLRALDDGSFQVDALMSVESFNEAFKVELDTEFAATIGGAVLHELGELPRKGDDVSCAGLRCTVGAVEQNRITQLIVRPPETAPLPTVGEERPRGGSTTASENASGDPDANADKGH